MKKIFSTNLDAHTTSEQAVQEILSKYLQIDDAEIERNENGKPYLKTHTGLFFSVSHTAGKRWIAFSDENVGIDVELASRQVHYAPIIKRFSDIERREINDAQTFLRYWTIKESAIKWLGGLIANDLYKIRFENGNLYYGEIELPIHLTTFCVDDCLISVCSERDFTGAELFIL